MRLFCITYCQDDQPKDENEELDRAIALSLAEDAKKRNGKIGLAGI